MKKGTKERQIETMEQSGNLNEMGPDDTKTEETALVVQMDQHLKSI